MKRSVFQAYVRGSVEAVKLYQEAFGAELLEYYLHPDGTYYHSELNVCGQILAVSELPPEQGPAGGSTMRFCLHFGPEEEALARKAYDALRQGGQVSFPLGPCDHCPLMADLVDPFGVRWCLFAG